MPLPNFKQAFTRALTKIEEMLASKAKVGEAITSQLASGAVIKLGTFVYRSHKDKKELLELQHIQDIHAKKEKDKTGKEVIRTNLDGDGVKVATIHQVGTELYKKTHGNWYRWNGVDWVYEPLTEQ
jgi:hypothetical protein